MFTVVEVTSIMTAVSSILSLIVSSAIAYILFHYDAKSTLKGTRREQYGFILQWYLNEFHGDRRQAFSQSVSALLLTRDYLGQDKMVRIFQQSVGYAPVSKLWRLMNKHRSTCKHYYETLDMMKVFIDGYNGLDEKYKASHVDSCSSTKRDAFTKEVE